MILIFRFRFVIARFEAKSTILLNLMHKIMHDNREIIRRFYSAFQKLDYKTMQDCYHDDAIFFDPVFQDLNAYEVRNMWEMLCLNAKDLKITFTDVESDGEYGGCIWIANYSFSKNQRKVTNKIKAYFRFREGKIIEHTDDFDLWKWSRQALGLPGLILGWSEFFQRKIRATAQNRLLDFLNNKASTS